MRVKWDHTTTPSTSASRPLYLYALQLTSILNSPSLSALFLNLFCCQRDAQKTRGVLLNSDPRLARTTLQRARLEV